jgi:hypothetical protein
LFLESKGSRKTGDAATDDDRCAGITHD